MADIDDLISLQEEDLFAYMGHLSRLVERHISYELQPHKISLAQARLLLKVQRDPQATQESLTSDPLLACPDVKRTISRLVSAGYLERKPDPSDRRVHLLRLTRQGKGMIGEFQRLSQMVWSKIFTGLTPCERLLFAELLKKIHHNTRKTYANIILCEPDEKDLLFPLPPRKAERLED